jgi:diadenosine tetraphosphatase ApaH/serine/threonine PP2A family protein phosphatase
MRYLLISDTHSNLEAMEAVFAAADHDRVLFMGDAVDYGPDPEGVVTMLRAAAKSGGSLVQGNHDQGASSPEGEFDDTGWAALATDTMRYSRLHLGPEAMGFLRDLPLTARVDLGAGGRALLCHGTPASNMQYLWPDLPAAAVEKLLGTACDEVDYLFVGHSHLQFERRVGSLRIANPGSVGQPRDGDPRAGYAIFDTARGALTFHRVKYPVEKTVAKIRERGMPHAERLARILERGGG